MRFTVYLLVMALACCGLLAVGCKLSDGDESDLVKATAVTGQDLVLDAGYATLVINATAIGSGAGQLPAGSVVSLSGGQKFDTGGHVYSPFLFVHATGPDGNDISGLSLSPPASIFLRYDMNASDRDGKAFADLFVLKKTGVGVTLLTPNASTSVTDLQFYSPKPGWVQINVTSFSTFVVTSGSGGQTVAEPVDLTGDVTTFLSFTVFSLGNAGATIDAMLAIPTGETTTVPKVLVLNDASYDAGNPSTATNRVLTVSTGGIDYTTDAASAAVTLTLDTFSGVNSSGSLVGTLMQDGGSGNLTINYHFTTDSAGAVALHGTSTDVGGRRSLTLTDLGSTTQVLILMPTSLPVAPFPATVTCNDASFDVLSPQDPAGRIVSVTQSGVNYSSDSASPAGSVDVIFAAFSAGVGSGSIQGTVVASGGATLSLNFTFTTGAGNGGTGSGTLTSNAPLSLDASAAVESAVVFDGTNFVVTWLSAVGTTNRTLQIQKVTTAGAETGTQGGVEPAAALDASGGLSAAISLGGVLVVAGATGINPATDSVIVLVIDYATPAITHEYNIGNGALPRAVFSAAGTGQFIVAYETAAGISVVALDAAGGTPTAPSAFLPATALTGLAASLPADDEILVTGFDGAGIKAQRFTATTRAAAGPAFDLTTSLGGGVCAFDVVSGRYLIFTQVQTGSFVSQVVNQLPVGSSTLDAQTINLVGFAAPTQAATGSNAVMTSDSSGVFNALVGDSTNGPDQIGQPIFGAIVGIDLDTTLDGPAISADGAGHFLAACAKGVNGISVVRFTVAP